MDKEEEEWRKGAVIQAFGLVQHQTVPPFPPFNPFSAFNLLTYLIY